LWATARLPLPAGVARVLLRQPAADRESFGKGCLCLVQLALRLQHFAHPAVRHRQVPLPAGVARVLLYQPAADRETFGKGHLRLGQLALRLQHVAEETFGIRFCPRVAQVAREFANAVRVITKLRRFTPIHAYPRDTERRPYEGASVDQARPSQLPQGHRQCLAVFGVCGARPITVESLKLASGFIRRRAKAVVNPLDACGGRGIIREMRGGPLAQGPEPIRPLGRQSLAQCQPSGLVDIQRRLASCRKRFHHGQLAQPPVQDAAFLGCDLQQDREDVGIKPMRYRRCRQGFPQRQPLSRRQGGKGEIRRGQRELRRIARGRLE
jgi:hypothetical protein